MGEANKQSDAFSEREAVLAYILSCTNIYHLPSGSASLGLPLIFSLTVQHTCVNEKGTSLPSIIFLVVIL